ncbi:hypothetical protein [Bordetella muralis]|uniref:hypothetical protein n=1 Tax=Bordetella muralis TaxID=1649130 RepID=UPI0039F07249
MMRSNTEGRPYTRKLAWALSLSLAVLLAACSNSDSDDDETTPPPPGGGTTECTADVHCAPAP